MTIKVILLNIIFLSSCTRAEISDSIKSSLAYSGKFLATHFALGVTHELGHYVTSKLLDRGSLKKGDYKFTFTPNIMMPYILEYPWFYNNAKNAAINIAGPLVGLLASYGTIKLIENRQRKCTNSCNATEKNEIVRDPIRLMAWLHIIANGIHLLPFKIDNFESDAHKIIEDLSNKRN